MTDIHESLTDKLRSLGIQTGAKHIAPPQNHNQGIESVVSGRYVETSFGDVFCSETACDISYTHGNVNLIKLPLNSQFIQWADSSAAPEGIDLSDIAFLDTETTGLSGGTGTIPFMIGIGRFTADGFVTTQIFIRNPAEERAQLELLDRLLAGVQAIVTYNGKAFDAPILKTRYVLNSLPSPLKNLPHYDLLPLSRRLWKRRLESRGLKDLETEILQFTRDQIEVPGWEIPILYFNYLRTGDPQPLAGVFYHNCIDIQSLAAVFLFMNQMVGEAQKTNNLTPVDLLSLAIQFESTGDIGSAISLFEKLLLEDLPAKYKTELQLRYARVLKRNGDFSRAASVLQADQSQKDTKVLIQLAKVLEHQQRDYRSALEYTIEAINALETETEIESDLYIEQQKSDLIKRKERLSQKMNSQGNS